MALKIFKYYLQLTDTQTLQMPEGFEVLNVSNEGGRIVFWAEADEEEELVDIDFYVVGTGNELEHPLRVYMGTVQMNGFVWHVYEI